MYIPHNLKKWSLSGWDNNYMGEDLSSWYILIAKTRDSDNMQESNYDCILQYLEDEEGIDSHSDCEEYSGVLIAQFGHWACGWIEAIMIHETNDTVLVMGDDIKDKLDNYPVFDDNDYSEREFNDFMDNCKQAIKDYANKYDLDFSDDKISELIHEGDDWYINGEFWPSDEQIEEVITGVSHNKHCTICNTDYKDYSVCKCQLRLF